MSEYCVSVGLDYRFDGEDHEVEINYWDSDNTEAEAVAKGKNFEDAANHCFMNLVENMSKESESEEINEEYVAELEHWLSELEASHDNLMEENDRLEHRIQDLQKQVAILQKHQDDWWGKNTVTDAPKSKYENTVSYDTKTKPKTEDSVDEMIKLLRHWGFPC